MKKLLIVFILALACEEYQDIGTATESLEQVEDARCSEFCDIEQCYYPDGPECVWGLCGWRCETAECFAMFPQGQLCHPPEEAGGGIGQCTGWGACWVDADGEYNWESI